ncbi:hypothetical protein GJAV_G00065600 [Gymnothorax javanicus]|nr:hypothetical protein GJAV_G00065600 [Gymnothorax javanicus]
MTTTQVPPCQLEDHKQKLRKADPPAPVPRLLDSIDPRFESSTHFSLQAVTKPDSERGSDQVKVSVLNFSNGREVKVNVHKSTTVGKVKEMYLQQIPAPSQTLQLVCNGKPLADHQTLEMLNLKGSAMFIICQRCVGG